MLFDFHTHIFPDTLAERAVSSLAQKFPESIKPETNGTFQGLLDSMQRSGVDMSLVVPIATKPSQTETLNRWAAEIDHDRVVMFGSINPHTDDYKRDIDLVASLRLKGIKLHPEYQDFLVNDKKMLDIYYYAFEKGLIIIQHAGEDIAYTAPFRGTPEMFADVARQMRGGVMVAAHLGGLLMWEEVREKLCGTEMYFDCSQSLEFMPKEQFVDIVNAHGADKVLFASDSPWGKPAVVKELLDNCGLDAEQRDLICYKNACRLLDIKPNVAQYNK